jgi:hypothetical protein
MAVLVKLMLGVLAWVSSAHAALETAAGPPAVDAGIISASCKISVHGLAEGSCVGYSFCDLAASAPSFSMNSSYPVEPYLIAPPFAEAVGPGGVCKACTPAQAGANGYQFLPGGPVCAARCTPLALPTAFLSAHPLSAADPTGGVVVTFGGGDGGRQLVHAVELAPGESVIKCPSSPLNVLKDTNDHSCYRAFR